MFPAGRDGCLLAPLFNLKDLEKIFRCKALKLLLAMGRITVGLVRRMEVLKAFRIHSISSRHPGKRRGSA